MTPLLGDYGPWLLKAALSLISERNKSNPLFDLVFFELDVLAHDRIIFLEDHLFGGVPRILFGHVKEACASGGQQFDLLNDGFSHGLTCWV
jgi:hypothetical protein